MRGENENEYELCNVCGSKKIFFPPLFFPAIIVCVRGIISRRI